ncbi:MAG: hypothetical protein K2P35_04700 [Lachnospiraceae bacterium]|nr:hypothetical protein [Lachnospiraceae bacterium]
MITKSHGAKSRASIVGEVGDLCEIRNSQILIEVPAKAGEWEPVWKQ